MVVRGRSCVGIPEHPGRRIPRLLTLSDSSNLSIMPAQRLSELPVEILEKRFLYLPGQGHHRVRSVAWNRVKLQGVYF